MSEYQSHSTKIEDEIDLFDLLDDIKSKWYWLVIYSILGLILSIGYALWATPVYKTSALITESTASDLTELNQPVLSYAMKFSLLKGATPVPYLSDDALYSVSTEEAFTSARSVIRSSSLRKEFYNILLKENDPVIVPLISSSELTPGQNLLKFLDRFSFADPNTKKEKDLYLSIDFELSKNPEVAKDLLNRYIELGISKHLAQTKDDLKQKMDKQVKLNNTMASSLRDTYETNKQRRILSLEEAASIAQSIGQKKPFYNANDVVVSSEPPLYMMGEQALRVEIAELKKRDALENQDVFVRGLPEIIRNINDLESLNIDWQSVNLVLIDQEALLPIKPIKPKKLLIVAAGIVGGFGFGLLAAVFAAASVRHRVKYTR